MKTTITRAGRRIAALALAALVMSSTASADESSLASLLYDVDLVDARFAEALEQDIAEAAALPEVMPFNADMVNVEKVLGDGEGVYVAVLDTGLLTSAPFFFSQANIAWDLGKGFSHDIYWDDDLGFVVAPLDDQRGYWTELASGHGTHVASTVVGFHYSGRSGSFWVRGIAPKATIIPVLVLDAWAIEAPFGTVTFSGGFDDMISEGIRYVADLAGTLDGPVVINMSLGGPVRSPMIEAAVDYAISKGVIVVVSAGNGGYDGMGYPGGLPQVISTAAAGWSSMFHFGWAGDVPEKTNSNDDLGNNTQYYLAGFSSRPNKGLGQKHQDLDITAPGDFVVGPYKSSFAENTGYYYLSGTSMSAPHVSAIAAMLLQSNPLLGQADVERALRQAGRGQPLPADGAIVAFPFAEPYYFLEDWLGGDYGAGFLRADYVVN